MDYYMPYMDGLQTIRKLRDNFPHPIDKQAIILLHSSSDDERIIKACQLLEINQRLVKPVKMNALYHALSRLGQVDDKAPKASLQYDTQANTMPLNVLIVEDNQVNRLLAANIVSRIIPNAHVSVANNGLEAVLMYTKEPPDFILMDIQMPEMNGYESAKRIRELEQRSGRHVPILALTAGSVKGEEERCLAAGMDEYITKPIIEESIRPFFAKWLRHIPVKTKTIVKVDDPSTHFNLQQLQQIAGHDPAFVNELMKVAENELENSVAVLQHLIQQGSLADLNAAGHKLYGTAASAGMPILAKLAREAEYLVDSDYQKVSQLVQKIVAEVKLIISLLA